MKESGQTQAAVTIIDDAEVLMEEEADWLYSIASELSKKTGWSVTALTSDEDSQLNATADNGILCQVDVSDGAVLFTANGSAENYFDTNRREEIIKEAQKPIEEQDYTQSLYLMLLGADKSYEAGEIAHTQTSIWIITGTAALCIILFIYSFIKIRRMKR